MKINGKNAGIALIALLLSREVCASPSIPTIMESHFVETCLRYNVPVALAHALIEWESGWNEQAVNYNTNGSIDLGIMQLNNQYLVYFGDRYNDGEKIDPWMWRVSIDIGIHHLSDLHQVIGYWPGAVAAYNMGLKKYRRYISEGKTFPAGTLRLLNHVFN
jgi:soluble lytic murein transglycosylase-like protein